MRRSHSASQVSISRIDDVSKSSIESMNYGCSICTDVMLFPCTLGCGHSFCYRCLKNMHKHVHNQRCDSDADSEDDSEDEVPQVPQNSVDSYRNAFFDDQCFKAVVGGSASNKFTSKLLMDKTKLLSHILNDSVFCDNCPNLKCPTCRVSVKVMPKPNILLHEALKHLLHDVYESRIQEYLANYCDDFILEQYEQSDRYKTIKMLVTESIGAIQQAVKFSDLMDSFGAYGTEEIVWCLNKLMKGNTFIIVKDLIISHDNYSSDFNKLLSDQRVTSDDINYLITSHPSFSLGNDSNVLITNLKKQFKGVRLGPLKMMDNEVLLNQGMRQCIVENNLLNW